MRITFWVCWLITNLTIMLPGIYSVSMHTDHLSDGSVGMTNDWTSSVGFSDVRQIDRLYGKCCSTDRHHTRAQIEWILMDTSVYWKIWTEVNFWDHKLFEVGMIYDRWAPFRTKIQIGYENTHTRIASKSAAADISNNILLLRIVFRHRLVHHCSVVI